MKNRLPCLLAGVWLALCSLPPQADDIDIYLDTGSGDPGAVCGIAAGLSLLAPSYAASPQSVAGHPDDIFFALFGVGIGP